MKITKMFGLEYLDKVISEFDFERYNIVSTKASIEEYFNKYGYSFVAPFDLERDLILVQDKNFEISMLLGMVYNSLLVINYKTGELVESRLVSAGVGRNQNIVVPFLYRVINCGEKSKLIKNDSNEVILEADFITCLSSDKVLFRKYNIEYIIDLNTLELYPLIKKEHVVYQGADREKFIDFRNGMYYHNQNCIFSIDIKEADIDYLVKNFPFGEKRGRLFLLLDNPLKYGIRYEEGRVGEIWYDTEEERDKVYSEINDQILSVFEEEKQKKKIKQSDV